MVPKASSARITIWAPRCQPWCIWTCISWVWSILNLVWYAYWKHWWRRHVTSVKPTIKKFHRIGGVNDGNLFLMALEAKIKIPALLVSGEDSLRGLQMATCLVSPHVAERKRSSSSEEVISPINLGPHLMPSFNVNQLQIQLLGVRSSTYEF